MCRSLKWCKKLLVERKFKCDASDDECRVLVTTCHTQLLIKKNQNQNKHQQNDCSKKWNNSAHSKSHHKNVSLHQ